MELIDIENENPGSIVDKKYASIIIEQVFKFLSHHIYNRIYHFFNFSLNTFLNFSTLGVITKLQ